MLCLKISNDLKLYFVDKLSQEIFGLIWSYYQNKTIELKLMWYSYNLLIISINMLSMLFFMSKTNFIIFN